jgi:hypothetical protein
MDAVSWQRQALESLTTKIGHFASQCNHPTGIVTLSESQYCLSVHINTKTSRKVKGFDNKHFLIRRIRRHLVTKLSAANGKKKLP